MFTLLLICGIAVSQGSWYTPTIAASYYQVESLHTDKEFSASTSQFYVYSKQAITQKATAVAWFIRYRLHDVVGVNTPLILKTQQVIHRAINSTLAQREFLKQTFSSSNQKPSLYIA